jgi:myo-inositol-hexaphosphate 3-phosphohydrolase
MQESANQGGPCTKKKQPSKANRIRIVRLCKKMASLAADLTGSDIWFWPVGTGFALAIGEATSV